MKHNKGTLYEKIHKKLFTLGADDDWYPLNLNQIISASKIEVEYYSFDCDHIGAVLIKDETSGMLVNNNRPIEDRRFDMAHELIHYWFHPMFSSFSFDTIITQDRHLEWEANEGAAELLVPYRDFIPRFLNSAKFAEENYESIESIYENLAKYYQVNPIVIDYRIRNLDNEILQVFAGKNINKIVIGKSNCFFERFGKISMHQDLLKKLNLRFNNSK